MRPIEFRAQRADTGEFVYGDLVKNGWGCFIIEHFSIDNGKIVSSIQHQVIPETVGQFTGRNDVNGKKIFECDKDESGYFIQYVDEYACFCYLDKELNVAFQCVPTFFEVIGTIHD